MGRATLCAWRTSRRAGALAACLVAASTSAAGQQPVRSIVVAAASDSARDGALWFHVTLMPVNNPDTVFTLRAWIHNSGPTMIPVSFSCDPLRLVFVRLEEPDDTISWRYNEARRRMHEATAPEERYEDPCPHMFSSREVAPGATLALDSFTVFALSADPLLARMSSGGYHVRLVLGMQQGYAAYKLRPITMSLGGAIVR